jgi:hypothetical protein
MLWLSGYHSHFVFRRFQVQIFTSLLLPWMKVSMIFLHRSRWMAGKYHKSGHNWFLPYKLTVTQYLAIQTKKQIKSMQKSPSWKANSHSVTQETSRVIQNPKVHYHVHNILSQTNPLYTLPFYFFKIYLDRIYLGAHSSVLGWGTMLQAGRLQLQFLMKSLEFFQLT